MKRIKIELLSFTVICLVFISCNQSNNSHKLENAKVDKGNDVKLSLDTFSTFPDEIDGCACYFSNNESEFKKNTYVYADDYGENCFVKINGIMTKFKLTGSDTFPNNRSVRKVYQ